MNILITGGSGYLGSALANHFKNSKYNIFISSRNKNYKYRDHSNINFKFINWESDSLINRATEGIDIVIHAAGMNSKDCELDPKSAFRCNHIYTKKLLESSKSNGVKKFLYISTAHVYKSPLEGFIDETTEILNSHPYASSHAAGEKEVVSANNHNFISNVVRLSNVFGANEDLSHSSWKLFLNAICLSAIKSKNIKLLDKKLHYRDFLSITDFANSIEFLINKMTSKVNIYNLGSGYSYSILDAANIVREEALKNYDLKITLKANKFEVTGKRLQFNIDRILKLGLSKKNNLRKEINKLILFIFQKNT